MAEIINLANPADLRPFLESLDEGGLIGQQLSQQGAIHVLTYLLTNGCTEDLVIAMLASLRQHMEEIVQVAEAKGYTRVFDKTPPNFN